MTIQPSKSRSLGKFYLVLLLFLVPMIGSWILYLFHSHVALKTVNHGQFISPPISAEFLYHNPPTNITKTWRIVHVNNGHCDTDCEKINFQLNQVRKVLGKDQDRLLVISLNAKTTEVEQLQHIFQQKKLALAAGGKIYLVDPLGNLFMYYPEDIKPMDVLKDLKRVLEVSQIG